jgi:hypothetical protein
MIDRKLTLSERGTKDDWETLKVILDSMPSLRARVLFKLKDLRSGIDKRREGSSGGSISISKKESQNFRLEEKGISNKKDK